MIIVWKWRQKLPYWTGSRFFRGKQQDIVLLWEIQPGRPVQEGKEKILLQTGYKVAGIYKGTDVWPWYEPEVDHSPHKKKRWCDTGKMSRGSGGLLQELPYEVKGP